MSGTEETTSDSSEGEGANEYGVSALTRIADGFNEYASAIFAAGVFDCAVDTTEAEANNDDEFFNIGEIVSPTMANFRGDAHRQSQRSSGMNLPDTNNTSNEATTATGLALTPESLDLERAPVREETIMDGISTLTPLEARPLPLTMDLGGQGAMRGGEINNRNTWDELHYAATFNNNIPADQSDDDRIVLNAEWQGVSDHHIIESSPSDDDGGNKKKKKNRCILGALVVLAVILLAGGIAAPLTLNNNKASQSSAEQNNDYATAEGSDNGDNIIQKQNPPPTSYAPTASPEQTMTQFTVITSSSSSSASPNTSSENNEPAPIPSPSTSISWEGSLFSDESLTGDPPPIEITSPINNGQIMSPTSPPPSAANIESTSSPKLSLANPTTSAPTMIPPLIPITAKPSSFSTKFPTAESPITGQPISGPTTYISTSDQPTSLAPTPLPTPPPTPPLSPPPTPPPTPSPTPPPTTKPTPPPQQASYFDSLIAAQDGKADEQVNTQSGPTTNQSRLNIELKTDQYGHETSWTLYSIDADTDAQINLIASVEENSYQPFEQDSRELYLSPGKYRFALKDAFGDGFCCSSGSDGWYVISLDDRELLRGDYYMLEVTYDILVGHTPDMSQRDQEWLDAHNDRRKTWHERHGETYMPLVWSTELATRALSWAQELLNDCDIVGISHESDVKEGENLAKNKAGGEGGMGILYPPENILRRWVDKEEFVGYPGNAHLTQALWRASRYVGCGDAVRNYNDGSICRVQVCRYVRAGNCAMSSFDSKEGDNWLVPMLMERTQCGPHCAPEGCF